MLLEWTLTSQLGSAGGGTMNGWARGNESPAQNVVIGWGCAPTNAYNPRKDAKEVGLGDTISRV